MSNKKSIIVLIIAAIVIILGATIIANVDNIVFLMDLNARTKNLEKAYNERKIIKEVKNEFSEENGIGIKLLEAKVEDTLNLKFAMKLKDLDEDGLKAALGLTIYDENNNIYMVDSNSFIVNILDENKKVYDVNEIYPNETITPYFRGLQKELNIKIKETYAYNRKMFYNLEKTNDEYILNISLDLKDNTKDLNSKKLYIRLNDVMIFRNKKELNPQSPDMYNKFTEWQFEKDL